MSESQQKTVLVTGCSLGSLGDAFAREFQQRGYHVIATARSLSRVEHLAKLGIQIEELDVTSPTSIQALRTKVQSLDILFNNAGGLKLIPVSDASMEDWRQIFDQNFFSVVEITQAFLPFLLDSKGIIVNHTSQQAYFGFVGGALYASSKSAVRQYSDNLRNELHPFGVRVVELISGAVGSNIIRKQMLHQPVVLPSNSIYSPIKNEMREAFKGEVIQGKETEPSVHARNVVSDLLDGGGWFSFGKHPPQWIWRGFSSTTSYWVWLIGCHWKGLFDPILQRLSNMNILAARLKEKARKEQ